MAQLSHRVAAARAKISPVPAPAHMLTDVICTEDQKWRN